MPLKLCTEYKGPKWNFNPAARQRRAPRIATLVMLFAS
jgi:hypothetical protein